MTYRGILQGCVAPGDFRTSQERSPNYGKIWRRYSRNYGPRHFAPGDPVRLKGGRRIGVVTTIYQTGPRGESDVVGVVWPDGRWTAIATSFLRPLLRNAA